MVSMSEALTADKTRQDQRELLEKIHNLEIRIYVLANTAAKTNKLLNDVIKVITMQSAKKNSGK